MPVLSNRIRLVGGTIDFENTDIPAENCLGTIVSLLDLVATGCLGRLHAGLSLRDAVEILGPPQYCAGYENPINTVLGARARGAWVWDYDRLKLVFGGASPWPMLFFAIDLTYVDAGTNHLLLGNICGDTDHSIVLELGGIDSKTSLSCLLSLMRRGDSRPVVYAGTYVNWLELSIELGQSAVCFQGWHDKLAVEAGLADEAKVARLADAELWRALDAKAELDCVICSSPMTRAEPTSAVTRRILNPSSCPATPSS